MGIQSLDTVGNQIKMVWDDGHESVYDNKFLREKCPCAACQGEPLLFGKGFSPIPVNVPNDVKPVSFGQVGAYAISIDWSDGHNTGIYSFKYLRELCQCQQCKSGSS